jgi:aspartyl-tRNA(Asn)/glutamyl-tRNA(Gln) amidotransferase subunit B
MSRTQQGDWQLTVGMEIHVELETQTKLFCGCLNDPFHSKPNTNVCPICYGLPGTLPALNRRAVEMTLQLGQALNGQIAPTTFWARKNYFYPDLPKGYQISQSNAPLIEAATLSIDGHSHRIKRIHLEEDAGKLTHISGRHSLVDYNRAGVPLVEIVTEPDFTDAAAAKHFCQELQRVMRHLKLSQADMEKGLMRCEANISIRRQESEGKSQELGTKVEVKNINSFRAVEKAIEFEFARQVKALEAGEAVAHQTRTWDEGSAETKVMRVKETGADYRYFPEPDLPSVNVGKALSERASVLLPDEQRQRLRKLGLPEAAAKIIVDRHEFESLTETYKLASSRFRSDAQVRRYVLADATLRLGMPSFSRLTANDRLDLLQESASMGWAKSVIEEMIRQALETGRPVLDFAAQANDDEHGAAQMVIEENPTMVEDYRSGKEAALNALVGQVMAKTKGRVNAQKARETLRELLR